MLNTEEQDKEKIEQDVEELYQEKDKVVPKIEIFMARAYIKNLLKKAQDALKTLNEGIVYYSNFTPFMIERLICLMSLSEWEEYHQSALEISQRDSSNIVAAKALALYELAREGNVDNAFMKIR